MFKSQQFTETKYDKQARRRGEEVSTLTVQQTHLLPSSSVNQEQENCDLESSQPTCLSSLPIIKRQSRLSSTAVLLGRDSLTFLKLIL